jgi:hypothetical protein
MKVKITIAVLAFLTSVVVAQSSTAHHGFDGRYDTSRPIYLEGTVRSARWQAPHSIVELDLPKTLMIPSNLGQARNIDRLEKRTLQTLVVPQKLLGTTQRLEFPPVGSMVNPLRNRLRSGNRMAAIAYRNCESPHQLRVQFVRLTDGTTVVRPGTVQTEVNGCGR